MIDPIQNTKVHDLVKARTDALPPRPPGARAEFDDLLADRLKLSAHARTRLQSRDIRLDGTAWERVLTGIDRAAQKGARETLVMVDDVALVVSVKNRTVITAVDRERLRENVFTNIDSAVIA